MLVFKQMTLSCPADTRRLAVENLQLSSRNCHNFFIDLKLVLGASKTKLMPFSRAAVCIYQH